MKKGYDASKSGEKLHICLLVHKILTCASILARARGTLIDIFLTEKARKSHLTNTAGKEKSLLLIFCL